MSGVHNELEFGFYLPHHAVFKEDSLTTKIRVVFDGSAKSKSGLSLNDTLMVGPTIQEDVFSHLLRFRLHSYVLTGDIEKMYRQFKVRDEDTKFQRILWRRDGKNIETFELNTVTFGLSASPYLAIRALRQLADDEGYKYPEAAIILKRDLYVDDLITGVESVEEGIKIREDLTKLLSLGGLNIRQWASNDTQLLQGIAENNINLNLQFRDDKTLKTLGVSWNSLTDNIIYSAQPSTINSRISKRTMLSEIAKLFDPLGLLGPIILFAKVIMQKLWQVKLDWDESVPSSIHTTWIEFCSELSLINNLTFERKTLVKNTTHTQLHGFCDASEKGYGACIYIRFSDDQGHTRTRLLCAKSRVSPLKTISLPRLELCAAQLLGNLYATVHKTINITVNRTIFWTDSTIALSWINNPPHRLKTFVANRVSDIQEKTGSQNWRHIKSDDNPADALSRGQMPAEFIRNNLWKFGPIWLNHEETSWPAIKIQSPQDLPETKNDVCLTTSRNIGIFQRFSSFSRMKRIIAYCLRMKPNNRQKGPLQVEELDDAEKTIIRVIQTHAFAEEIHALKMNNRVNKKSKLLSLDPFID